MQNEGEKTGGSIEVGADNQFLNGAVPRSVPIENIYGLNAARTFVQ